MERLSVNITDVTLEAPVATTIEINVMELVLNSHVIVAVSFKNSNGNLLKNEMVKIEGEEYAGWGSDDEYLINLVLTKLNLTKETI
jgi:hypothetical protein